MLRMTERGEFITSEVERNSAVREAEFIIYGQNTKSISAKLHRLTRKIPDSVKRLILIEGFPIL